MKTKRFAGLLLAVSLGTVMGTAQVNASWLGDTLHRINHALEETTEVLGGTSTPGYNSQSTAESSASYADIADPKASRWILVEKTPNYNLYIDRKTMTHGGEAQKRYVEGYFKRQYTPIGSQRLGNFGHVRPDVITHSIYYATFTVDGTDRPDWYNVAKYYDVHNHLIYDGHLFDRFDEYDNWGGYTPDSKTEQLKNKLFHMFGWDY